MRVAAVPLTNGRVQVDMEDDGRGMDLPSARASDKMGLASLQERARQLDAQLHIDTAPGAGTRVTLTVIPHVPDAP